MVPQMNSSIIEGTKIFITTIGAQKLLIINLPDSRLEQYKI